MGFWGVIKTSVNSDLTTPLNTLMNSNASSVGNYSDAVSNTGTTLWGRVKYAVSQLTTISGKNIITYDTVIKSIQRGTSSGSTASLSITISSVTASKCKVTPYPGIANYDYGRNSMTASQVYPPYVTSLTATTLTIAPSWAVYSTYDGALNLPLTSEYYGYATRNVPFSWEIVEYY